MALDLLKGMKVIEIADFMAAPLAGRILAEWGADVIKVEPTRGCSFRGVGIARHILNGDQAGFDAINGGKRYLALDTRNPEGLAILQKMAEQCDVFISHLREKDQVKLGLDYETLKAKNPKIIVAGTSGYGQKGAWAARGGFDGASYAARCGYVLDCPLDGDSPMVPYFGFGDIPSGTYLAMGIMAAYIKQQRTGEGDKVNAALMHAGMWSVGFPIVSAAYGDQYPTDPATVLPLARPYTCGDGKVISLMGLNWDVNWPMFCKALDLPEEYITKWVGYDVALANAAEIGDILEKLFASQPRQYFVDRLMDTPMPFDICQHFEDMQEDQQAWDAGFFQGVDYPSGKHVGIVKAPAMFGSGEAELSTGGYPGDDSREVLKEYVGLSDAEIDALREKGLVAEGDQWNPDIYNMEKMMAQAAAAKKAE